MKKFILLSIAALVVTAVSAAAQTTPPPGCRPALAPELVADAASLDYALTDTGGLNVVLVHLFGQTTLSDLSCLPDSEQGSLSVVVNYGETSSKPPEEEARDMVWSRHATRQPYRRPDEFPPITVTAANVNGLPTAEALSFDTIAQGGEVFRYALVFVFPDGAKGLLSASGPRERFETLRPTLLRIGAGLRPRRNVQEMQQDLTDAFDNMLVRLRGPVVDQALDACLSGAFTREAAIARATATGFPAFEAEPPTRNGEQWYQSLAPQDDRTAQVAFGVMEGPSGMMPGTRSLTCAIVGPPALAALFHQKFDARFPGNGAARMFTVSGGQVTPQARGATVQVGPGGGVGRAGLVSDARMSAMTIEVTPLN